MFWRKHLRTIPSRGIQAGDKINTAIDLYRFTVS